MATCEQCSRGFERKRSWQRFCSKDCREIWYREATKKSRHEQRRAGPGVAWLAWRASPAGEQLIGDDFASTAVENIAREAFFAGFTMRHIELEANNDQGTSDDAGRS